MRRSFGPGMGSGGGGGGGGMITTVHRAVRAGIGGGASKEPYSHSSTTTTRTTNNRNQPINTTLSLSSNNPSSPCSYLNHPVPVANWVISTLPTTSTEEFDWECIDGGGSDGDSVNGVYDDFVFGSVPSKDEVHHAVSSLQEVLDPVSFSQLIKDSRTFGVDNDGVQTSFHKNGSELDWIEPSLQLCHSTSMLHVSSSNRVYDAFHLLQTEPTVQRMVISLSSDKAVWDAVMNNEVVRELRELVNEDNNVSEGLENDVDGSNPITHVLRWIFVNMKEKVIEIIEKITKIVNELAQPMSKDKKPKGKGDASPDSFEEKLKSSFLLSVMVLLIVVMSRARKC